jgi:hypothetical protein
MVIRALDLVKQCYSNDDGNKLFTVIAARMRQKEKTTISFDGVDSVPSSFVNSAFIMLLDDFGFEEIKRYLSFQRTTPQINEMIRSRFSFENQRRQAERDSSVD